MTQLVSTITCPICGHHATEAMPTDACRYFYECKGCDALLKPKLGDCCVFCSVRRRALPSRSGNGSRNLLCRTEACGITRDPPLIGWQAFAHCDRLAAFSNVPSLRPCCPRRTRERQFRRPRSLDGNGVPLHACGRTHSRFTGMMVARRSNSQQPQLLGIAIIPLPSIPLVR